MIEQDIGVKSVCRKTTNLGCKPVNGKYLCEAIRSIIVNSTGYEHPFTSACQCKKNMIKITLYLSLFNLLQVLKYFGNLLTPYYLV